MSSYIVISGNDKDMEGFEQQVSEALEEGYDFCAGLSAVTTASGEVKLFQPMTYVDFDIDEDEIDDDEISDEDFDVEDDEF